MNTPTSVSTQLAEIKDTLALFGTNTAKHPFGIGYHDNEWWVYVDIRSPLTDYDVESHDADLIVALSSTLARLRRELTHHGIRAA